MIRETTGGTDQFGYELPANTTVTNTFVPPWNQNEAGGTWRVDFGVNAAIPDPNDVTDTDVDVIAQFIRNV